MMPESKMRWLSLVLLLGIARGAALGHGQPSVTISVSPSVACIPSPVITYTGTAQDPDGVWKIVIYVDGHAKKTCVFGDEPPWAQCVHTEQYDEPGAHPAYAKAWDVAGNPPEQSNVKQFYAIGGPITGPSTIRYKCDSPAYTYTATSGQPAGTSYQWSIAAGADKAHIDGSTTQTTAKVIADAPSAAENDVTLRLKYSHSGHDCYANKGITVLVLCQSCNDGYCAPRGQETARPGERTGRDFS